MPKPRVELKPEPLEALRARYPLAVTEVINSLDVLAGTRPSPGGAPEHVFDTEDGLRLIVSFERLPDGRSGVHVSASFHDASRTHGGLDGLLRWIGDTWRSIASSTRVLEFLGVSEGGVPHFFVERGH